MTSDARCNQKVFKDGSTVALLDARADPAEAWVTEVAKRSNQPVDWHYSGGIVNVLFLGDRQKVINAIRSMPEQSGVRVMSVYSDKVNGPYREGVTEMPEGAVASFADVTTGNPIYLTANAPVHSNRTKPWWRRMWDKTVIKKHYGRSSR